MTIRGPECPATEHLSIATFPGGPRLCLTFLFPVKQLRVLEPHHLRSSSGPNQVACDSFFFPLLFSIGKAWPRLRNRFQHSFFQTKTNSLRKFLISVQIYLLCWCAVQPGRSHLTYSCLFKGLESRITIVSHSPVALLPP